MVSIKGTALKTTREFVKTHFPEQYDNWLNALPENSKNLYAKMLDVTQWYPLDEAYKEPIDQLIKMFYNGNVQKGAHELGYFSADIALKGLYKVFLLVASPKYLMSRASKMFSTFYNPSKIMVDGTADKNATLKIIEFDNIDEAIEYRIAGWILRALELANCDNPHYKIKKSKSANDDCTEIEFFWN